MLCNPSTPQVHLVFQGRFSIVSEHRMSPIGDPSVAPGRGSLSRSAGRDYGRPRRGDPRPISSPTLRDRRADRRLGRTGERFCVAHPGAARRYCRQPGAKISLKTAMMDVLGGANPMRVPVMIEYDELNKLQVNAATDALTGLHNRRGFDEYFDKEIFESRETLRTAARGRYPGPPQAEGSQRPARASARRSGFADCRGHPAPHLAQF